MASIVKQIEWLYGQVQCLKKDVDEINESIPSTLQQVTTAGNITDKTMIVDQGASQGIYSSSVAAIYDSTAQKGAGLHINGLVFQHTGAVTNVSPVDHGSTITPIQLYYPAISGNLIVDAPVNGTTYNRKDGGWVPASGGGGISGTYVDLAALLADQGSQTAGSIYFLDDATGISGITGISTTAQPSPAYIEYLGTTTPSAADYRAMGQQTLQRVLDQDYAAYSADFNSQIGLNLQGLSPSIYWQGNTVQSFTNLYVNQNNIGLRIVGYNDLDEAKIELHPSGEVILTQIFQAQQIGQKTLDVKTQVPVANTILLFPSKAVDGTYTLATTEDVPNLQAVTDVGAVTTKDLTTGLINSLKLTAGAFTPFGIYLGTNAGGVAYGGIDTIAIGASAAENVGATSVVAIGNNAMKEAGAATGSVALGTSALRHTDGLTEYLTAIGAHSSEGTVGTPITFSNSTSIGAFSTMTKSNQIVLGDAAVTEVVMGNGDIVYPAVAPPASTLYKDRMVPFTVIEYYGSLANFDAGGIGTGDYTEIYLCNGANGTPDKRGRAGVGVTVVPGGGAYDPEVDPVNPNNISFTLLGTAGTAKHVLTEAELAEHTHFAITSELKAGAAPHVDLTTLNYALEANETGGDFSYNILAVDGITPDVGIASLTGADTPHLNTQPSLGCYYIMYIPV
jgi:hypothetical protein